MTTIQAAIESAIKRATALQAPARKVTDLEVAKLIDKLAGMGYIPSAQIAEPLRAYLQGYALLLTGPAGVGKTFLMRCLKIKLWAAGDITAYGIRDLPEWYSWTDEADICIDDLGAESIVAEFGAKEDVLKVAISHREYGQTVNHRPTDLQPARVGRTHVTTNLTAREIAARYGDRTLSRLLGMCKPFAFEGQSKRQAVADTGGIVECAWGRMGQANTGGQHE